jgi:hypothetical protein
MEATLLHPCSTEHGRRFAALRPRGEPSVPANLEWAAWSLAAYGRVNPQSPESEMVMRPRPPARPQVALLSSVHLLHLTCFGLRKVRCPRNSRAELLPHRLPVRGVRSGGA